MKKDQAKAAEGLNGKVGNEYAHIVIDHNYTYPFDDGQHNNTIGNRRAMLKRSVYGIFYHFNIKPTRNDIWTSPVSD